MKKKLLFGLIIMLLLAPGPVAYAYAQGTGPAGPAPVRIEAAAAAAAPSWNVYQNAIGSVNRPGDLFYLDMAEQPADTVFTLYLTNAGELARNYRYLILQIGIYVQGENGQWAKAEPGDGAPFPETYLTLRNGNVAFALPGYARYKIAIDRGSFYYYSAGPDGNVSPHFYLTAE